MSQPAKHNNNPARGNVPARVRPGPDKAKPALDKASAPDKVRPVPDKDRGPNALAVALVGAILLRVLA